MHVSMQALDATEEEDEVAPLINRSRSRGGGQLVGDESVVINFSKFTGEAAHTKVGQCVRA